MAEDPRCPSCRVPLRAFAPGGRAVHIGRCQTRVVEAVTSDSDSDAAASPHEDHFGDSTEEVENGLLCFVHIIFTICVADDDMDLQANGGVVADIPRTFGAEATPAAAPRVITATGCAPFRTQGDLNLAQVRRFSAP